MKKQSIGNKKYWQSVIVIGIVLGLMVTATTAFAQDPKPGVFPPDEVVSGMTYGDWSAAWWQYVFSIPAPNNPLNDMTGQNCDLQQSSGPLFFLGGSWVGTVKRKCTVPAGKAIFFPIINVECSSVEPTPFYCNDEAKCRACAGAFADGIDTSTLEATIDEVEVDALSSFRVQSPVFDFTLAKDTDKNNILGVPPGKGKGFSVSDGYWLMLAPLSPGPGNHVIHFAGACRAGSLCEGFSQDVTYELTVTQGP